MPNAPDPSKLSLDALRARHTELRANVVSTNVLVRHVAAALHDPKSLDVASDLLQSTLAILDLPGSRGREELVREVNLSNAAVLAVIDLVRAHADAPRLPRAIARP